MALMSSRPRKILARFLLLLLLGLVVGTGWLLHLAWQANQATQALIAAVKSHDTARVQLLLQDGADPNVEDKPPQPVSWLTLFRRWFLHRTPRPVRSPYPSALLIAAKSNDVSIMRLL